MENLEERKKRLAARTSFLRNKKSWTIYQLAEISGLPLRWLQRLEEAQISPSHKAIGILAQTFGMDIQDFDPNISPDDN